MVAVDDLDRVTPEEVVEVVRFLKANGDLPNLVYLILADAEYLANALGGLFKDAPKSALEEGRRYLNKIVTLPCPMPAISSQQVERCFEKEIVSLVNDYGLPEGHLSAAIRWVCLYLENLRDAKRLLNAYALVLARRKRRVDGRTFLGVDTGDLLVVTALRIHESELYGHLVAGMHKLLENATVEQRMLENPGVDDVWLEEHFFRYVKTEHHARIREFLQDWLGMFRKENVPGRTGNAYELNNPDAPEDMAGFRLRSRYSFDSYFLEDNAVSLVEQADVEGFKRHVILQQFPSRILEKLDAQRTLHLFLYALKGLDTWESWDTTVFFMRTLVWMGGREWHPVPEDFPDLDLCEHNIYERIYECLSLQCARLGADPRFRRLLPQGQTVGDCLIGLLERENDVVMTAHLLSKHGPAHVHDKNGVTRDNLFSVDEFKRLQDGYLKRIQDFHSRGKMMSHPDCGILLSGWVYIVLENGYENERMAFQRVFLSELQKRGSAWKALSLYGTWAPVVEEYGAYLVNLDSLERVLGREGVKQVVATLAPTADTDNVQARTVRLLEWVMERKEHGKPYGEAEQLEYLQHLQRQREKVANLPQDPTSKEESCGAESSKAAESLL